LRRQLLRIGLLRVAGGAIKPMTFVGATRWRSFMQNILRFKVDRLPGGAVRLEPVIDGHALSDMAAQFEQSHGYEPAGGYGGIIPRHLRSGPVNAYFLGQPSDKLWRPDGSSGLWVLGCKHCWEVGCWGLLADIRIQDHGVVWDRFTHNHRAQRDYHAFGPFCFDLRQYTAELDAMRETYGV
jgi:hypothetical protein